MNNKFGLHNFEANNIIFSTGSKSICSRIIRNRKNMENRGAIEIKVMEVDEKGGR